MIPKKWEQTLKSVKADCNALEGTCINELTGEIWITTADIMLVDTGTQFMWIIRMNLVSLFQIGDALSSCNVVTTMFDALRSCHRL